MTDVTIRGIDDDVYALFAGEAKKRGASIGELTTVVMRALVEEAGVPSFRIGDLKELTVSKKDLDSVGGRVAFAEIAHLEFADDVDWATFNARVESIRSVSKVVLPRSLTKFQVLTRCRLVGNILAKK